MLKLCLQNLSSNQILSVVDCAENYFFQWQNEIQSQHWFSFWITILVHLSFRIREHQDGNLDTKIVTKYHFISVVIRCMTTFFIVMFWVTHAIPPKPKLPTPYRAHCVLRWIFLTIQMWKVSLLCCTLSIIDQ